MAKQTFYDEEKIAEIVGNRNLGSEFSEWDDLQKQLQTGEELWVYSRNFFVADFVEVIKNEEQLIEFKKGYYNRSYEITGYYAVAV